jgi:hypothetical protein
MPAGGSNYDLLRYTMLPVAHCNAVLIPEMCWASEGYHPP